MFTVTSAWFDALIAGFWWPFVRIMAIFMVEPFFASRSIPRRVKIFLGLAVTIAVSPILPPMPQVEPFSSTGILVTVNQILIGVAIGFAMRLVFSAMEMAGHLAGLQMGLGFASFFDPQNAQQLPVVALLTGLLATLLYVSFDGHLLMVSALVDSFRTIPVSVSPLSSAGFKQLFLLGGGVFSYGLWLAMPVVAVLLVANLSIGVMARASPQFNLFAVGFPITLALGLLVLYWTLPQMSYQFRTLVEEAIQAGGQVLVIFGQARD